MDSHAIAERASLIRHRLYAQEIERDPGLLAAAAEFVAKTQETRDDTFGIRVWKYLLTQPVSDLLDRMLDQGEMGQILRSNSPFSVIIGQKDISERRLTWKMAIEELSTGKI